MKSLVVEGNTWLAYEQLKEKEKKSHKNLCKIIKEMLRDDPSKRLSKPEPLKHNLSDLWSRRISQQDRVVSKFDDDYVYIALLI